LADVIREQGILADFPGRTETDLYLWIISHQWYLKETLGKEISPEEAADQLIQTSPTKQPKGKGASAKNKNE